MPDIDPDVNQQGLLATLPMAVQPPTVVSTPAQSFDSPDYQKSVYEWEQDVRRKAEAARAEQAIQSGIRYIYQRRYDDDLKNGLSEPKAFSRMMLGIALHTPKSDPTKLYQAFQQPFTPAITNIGGRDILRSGRYGERATALQAPIPTGPVNTEPLIGTDGKPIPGVRAARGTSGALHVIKEAAEEARASPSLNFQMLRTAIATAQKDLSEFGKEDPEYKPLKAKLDGLNAELEAMRTKKPSVSVPVAPQVPIPLPAEKSQLKKDRLYQTRRGVARWDGEKFIAQ